MLKRCVLAAMCFSTLVACGSTGDATIGEDPASFNPEFVSDDPVGTNAACVSALKNAALPAVNLVMMYDKSGSMGNPAEGGNPATKWVPVNTGMKAFFADPRSTGYNASLQFFPAPGDLAATCGANYSSPMVDITPLSKSQALAAALDKASPQGGTPTLPALEGALTFAAKTARARPSERTVVVLVTDGEPGLMVDGKFSAGCPNNDIDHVEAAAKKALASEPSIPTYVIGVGQQLTRLNGVAAAGGTNQAMMISVDDPTKTKAELQSALESIRASVKLSCDFELPEAPPGEKLDVRRVNVAFTSGGGDTTPLVYSKDCSADNGWRYDNLDAPTRIELCSKSCGKAQSDTEGKLQVAFGCMTNGIAK